MGWLAGAACWLVFAPFAFLYMAPFVLATWCLICLPLYAMIPLKSPLWGPKVCSYYGALSGATLVYTGETVLNGGWLSGFAYDGRVVLLVIATAAVTGGVAGWSAGKNVRQYRLR
jgi:hypothetical protein